MSVETTELVETTGTASLADDIERLKSGSVAVMSTFTGDDRDSRVQVLKAMTDSTPLDEHLGKEIELANFVVQQVDMPNEETGELVQVPRIILVTTDGKALHAISQGVFSALKNITGVLGMPADGYWPVKVKPTQEKTRKGYKVFTLKITG